jgi:hypothetical protein
MQHNQMALWSREIHEPTVMTQNDPRPKSLPVREIFVILNKLTVEFDGVERVVTNASVCIPPISCHVSLNICVLFWRCLYTLHIWLTICENESF